MKTDKVLRQPPLRDMLCCNLISDICNHKVGLRVLLPTSKSSVLNRVCCAGLKAATESINSKQIKARIL